MPRTHRSALAYISDVMVLAPFFVPSGLCRRLTSITGLGLGVNPYGLQRARMQQIISLEMKSDDQLARMGLTRDDILPHVFRDILAV